MTGHNEFAEFSRSGGMDADPGDGSYQNRLAIEDTEVELRVVLGTATLRVRDILKLGRGAVVELDRSITSTADVYVAGYFVGRGEVMITDDRMRVKLIEVFASDRTNN